MIQPTYKQIQETFYSLDYVFHTEPYYLNPFGIRSSENVAGKWNDLIGLAYTSEIGKEVVWSTTGTTDSGLFYLLNPMNINGCGAIVPGQYQNVYKKGYHKNNKNHPALIQIRPFKSYRDNTKDSVYEYNPNTIESGMQGANLHRALYSGEAEEVGNHSAMCQVVRSKSDLDYLLFLCDKMTEWQKIETYDYTLLMEEQLK